MELMIITFIMPCCGLSSIARLNANLHYLATACSIVIVLQALPVPVRRKSGSSDLSPKLEALPEETLPEEPADPSSMNDRPALLPPPLARRVVSPNAQVCCMMLQIDPVMCHHAMISCKNTLLTRCPSTMMKSVMPSGHGALLLLCMLHVASERH